VGGEDRDDPADPARCEEHGRGIGGAEEEAAGHAPWAACADFARRPVFAESQLIE
jgi:hypothetical protein